MLAAVVRKVSKETLKSYTGDRILGKIEVSVDELVCEDAHLWLISAGQGTQPIIVCSVRDLGQTANIPK